MTSNNLSGKSPGGDLVQVLADCRNRFSPLLPVIASKVLLAGMQTCPFIYITV